MLASLASLPLIIQAIISAVLVIVALTIFLARFARGKLWLGVALGVALADQASKFIVLQWGNGATKNLGLGFSAVDTGLLSATLAGIAVLVLLYLRLRQFGYKMAGLTELSCALILGGCLGILIDRVGRGFVIDWVDLGPKSSFIYNLADLAVIFAAVLLAARGVQFFANRQNRAMLLANGKSLAVTDPQRVGQHAAQALRVRFGEISPQEMAAALGVRIEHAPQPPPSHARLRVRSEYRSDCAKIMLYTEPLEELAQLVARNWGDRQIDLETLHIAHELYHYLEAEWTPASEEAAHAFVAELLSLDFSPAELDALYDK